MLDPDTKVKMFLNGGLQLTRLRRMSDWSLRHGNLRWFMIGRRGAIGSQQIWHGMILLPEYGERKIALWEWSKSLEANDIIEDDFSATSHELFTAMIIAIRYDYVETDISFRILWLPHHCLYLWLQRFKNSIILRNLFMLIWQMYNLFDGEENYYFIK